ncbi:MAG: RNA-binding S4 domain-containing protein [Synergistaceae bacterium]|jgi:ribosomal 50S subunit-recycling heat shock protein|nr:RNA-binding S4 domain-containing protein [Synergistaceae bacterium]
MRVDKFLKLSRLVKRRTAAQEMILVGAVRLNGRTIKPSAAVRIGDKIEVAYPRRVLSVEVLTTDEREIKRGVPCASAVLERRLPPDEDRDVS